MCTFAIAFHAMCYFKSIFTAKVTAPTLHFLFKFNWIQHFQSWNCIEVWFQLRHQWNSRLYINNRKSEQTLQNSLRCSICDANLRRFGCTQSMLKVQTLFWFFSMKTSQRIEYKAHMKMVKQFPYTCFGFLRIWILLCNDICHNFFLLSSCGFAHGGKKKFAFHKRTHWWWNRN